MNTGIGRIRVKLGRGMEYQHGAGTGAKKMPLPG